MRKPYAKKIKTEAADPDLLAEYKAMLQELYRSIRLRSQGETIEILGDPDSGNATVRVKQGNMVLGYYQLACNLETGVTSALMAGVRMPDHSNPTAMRIALQRGFAHIYKGTTAK